MIHIFQEYNRFYKAFPVKEHLSAIEIIAYLRGYTCHEQALFVCKTVDTFVPEFSHSLFPQITKLIGTPLSRPEIVCCECTQSDGFIIVGAYRICFLRRQRQLGNGYAVIKSAFVSLFCRQMNDEASFFFSHDTVEIRQEERGRAVYEFAFGDKFGREFQLAYPVGIYFPYVAVVGNDGHTYGKKVRYTQCLGKQSLDGNALVGLFAPLGACFLVQHFLFAYQINVAPDIHTGSFYICKSDCFGIFYHLFEPLDEYVFP